MRLQPIYDIAALCAAKGITQVILCPGSRCAPLTLAFARHPAIHTRTVFDERSAAFIALGMAQQLQQPVVLVCTSGTAAANFGPAVAEAFFQQIPLVIFTADRPAEWIGQYDGQTIYQSGLYQQHVKHAYSLPQEYDHPDSKWVINRTVNEAINLAASGPRGPVHINVPLREPLYPAHGENITFDEKPRVIEETSPAYELDYSIKQDIQNRLKN
ncbi:MAG: 2-succinyl-5-enolpyruvyl-6-hydroxy-3-cyclohexene-1-carboxylic-acid synthase, partial [Bacteroidia bacterium]|nr:2-succinyl-5-enolpyruvyl-6-hydroxy-3-cyclohexene-1-carboxylic-acid synthase [Bacteroidia bacterium]